MFAPTGYCPRGLKSGGFLSPSQGLQFSDVPDGLAALSKVLGAGIAQIVIFAGITRTDAAGAVRPRGTRRPALGSLLAVGAQAR